MFWNVDDCSSKNTRAYILYSYLLGLSYKVSYFKLQDHKGIFSSNFVFLIDWVISDKFKKDTLKIEGKFLEKNEIISELDLANITSFYYGSIPFLYKIIFVKGTYFLVNNCIMEIIYEISRLYKKSFRIYGHESNFFYIKDILKGEICGWFKGEEKVAQDAVNCLNGSVFGK